jgi:hypothetical protein
MRGLLYLCSCLAVLAIPASGHCQSVDPIDNGYYHVIAMDETGQILLIDMLTGQVQGAIGSDLADKYDVIDGQLVVIEYPPIG